MSYFQKIKCGIQNNDPEYLIISSFILGILFSGISFGLVYVIIFLIIWELLYYAYIDCNNRSYMGETRLLSVLYGIAGFLLGRFLHEDDDHHEEFKKFQNHYDYYGIEFGWFDVKHTEKRMRRKKLEEIKKK
jgi:hypothetical protein